MDQKDPEGGTDPDDDTDDDGIGGSKKNRNQKGDIEETVDLNADPEKPGGGEADSKPRRGTSESEVWFYTCTPLTEFHKT